MKFDAFSIALISISILVLVLVGRFAFALGADFLPAFASLIGTVIFACVTIGIYLSTRGGFPKRRKWHLFTTFAGLSIWPWWWKTLDSIAMNDSMGLSKGEWIQRQLPSSPPKEHPIFGRMLEPEVPEVWYTDAYFQWGIEVGFVVLFSLFFFIRWRSY